MDLAILHGKPFGIPLIHTVEQNVVAFFVFGETAASFSTRLFSSVTGAKRETIFLSGGE
jgi:hypothetical protein